MTTVKKHIRGCILLTIMLLFTIIVLDTQFKKLEYTQKRVYNSEISISQAIHREIISGMLSGTILTYGTSTISYRLHGFSGLSISLSIPIIGSLYLKTVEVWREMRLHVFESVFPTWYILGSCLGYLLLGIEITILEKDKHKKILKP